MASCNFQPGGCLPGCPGPGDMAGCPGDIYPSHFGGFGDRKKPHRLLCTTADSNGGLLKLGVRTNSYSLNFDGVLKAPSKF